MPALNGVEDRGPIYPKSDCLIIYGMISLDVIVSNPPLCRSGDIKRYCSRRLKGTMAYRGFGRVGNDGLFFYRENN